MGILIAAMEGITAQTGLSPTAFLTIAALMAVVYKTVTAMFVSPEDFHKSEAPLPDQNKPLRDMTEKELRAFNGSDPNKPLLISLRGRIYDVSSSRNFYGAGEGYSMFTGKEVSRAFALLSFKSQDMNANLDDLGDDELQVLHDWECKFIDKYPVVARLVTQETRDKQKDV